tara:strand:- start:301 stop:513 length:213 start_codon:yes stop_codon:yes gene_type:complete
LLLVLVAQLHQQLQISVALTAEHLVLHIMADQFPALVVVEEDAHNMIPQDQEEMVDLVVVVVLTALDHPV